MDRDVFGITTKGSNVIFHPFKRKSLISHGCVVMGQRCGFGESEYAQPVVHAYVNHRQAVVDGFDDQAARLGCQLIL
jgi:hypothetical protein